MGGGGGGGGVTVAVFKISNFENANFASFSTQRETFRATYQLLLLVGYLRNLSRTFIHHDYHRRKSAGEGR